MPYIVIYEAYFDMGAQIEISAETAAKLKKSKDQDPIYKISDTPFQNIPMRPQRLTEWPEFSGFMLDDRRDD
jgi:hypothetical protein